MKNKIWKVSLAIIIFSFVVGLVQASTFQGDEQRTGNFTADKAILPVLKWKKRIGGLVGASPIYWNGHIFVTNWYGWGDWNPGLYSLNASTGEIEWRNEKITGASTVAVGNTIVVGNLSGYLYYVNTSNGFIEKEVLLEPSPSWWGISSSPLVYNSSIYVLTFSNGSLWKLDSEGNIQWKITTGKISYYTSPTAYNGRIFFAGNESGNALFSVYENGNLSWKYYVEGSIKNTPSIEYGKVFFATDKKLYSLTVDGNLVWSVDFNGTMSSPAIANGRIYIGSAEGKLYCFDAENGDLIWEFTANGKIDSSPAIANGIVYFATNSPQGTVYAVDADTGTLMWFYRLLPPSGSYYNIMSSPFIADNKLYIGSDSGYVYCFDSSGVLEYNVSLIPVDFVVQVNGNTYNVTRATALGSLYAIQDYSNDSDESQIYFEITLDDSWYNSNTSSGLLISSIMGLGTSQIDGKWIYWSIWNGSGDMLSVSADAYTLLGNETVYYCYDGLSLENCSILIKINTKVKSAGISSFEAQNGNIGGNITAWVNITSAESDWYVVVVSGMNEDGESLAGLSTFYLSDRDSLSVPVLVSIPQLAKTGTYKLYAGIYKYSEYPYNPIHIFGRISVEVS